MPLAWREPDDAYAGAPGARVKALSTYAVLIARATDLHRAGNGCADIAAMLNQEAWRQPKRRDTFNAPMVRRLLTTAGIIEPGTRRPRRLPQRQPDEWVAHGCGGHRLDVS
jgi:hypothetical protein